MGRQEGEDLPAVGELPFLKKGRVAVGLRLVAEISKPARSTLPVVLLYVGGTGSRDGFSRAPNKGAPGYILQ